MDVPHFTVALRGYRQDQVDALIEQARQALASSDADQRAPARRALRDPELKRGFRGYDREQVDTYFTLLAQQLA
jgi:DivIVA domain-containing protein